MINKAILMGRLTRDPELRHTGNGTAVCSFTIAIDNGYGDNRTTDFINCVAWNKTAEFVEKYFSKGRLIIVVGRIQTRTWEGQDGKKNYATEVVVDEAHFTGSRADEGGARPTGGFGAPAGNAPANNASPSFDDAFDEMDFAAIDSSEDDLPF